MGPGRGAGAFVASDRLSRATSIGKTGQRARGTILLVWRIAERHDSDQAGAYSSRGPAWYDGIATPDILAPGQALVSNDATGSTLETSYPSLVLKSGSNRYLRLSGPSMATGVVAGLAAIMIEANQFAAEQRWQQSYESIKRNLRPAFPG